MAAAGGSGGSSTGVNPNADLHTQLQQLQALKDADAPSDRSEDSQVESEYELPDSDADVPNGDCAAALRQSHSVRKAIKPRDPSASEDEEAAPLAPSPSNPPPLPGFRWGLGHSVNLLRKCCLD